MLAREQSLHLYFNQNGYFGLFLAVHWSFVIPGMAKLCIFRLSTELVD
jgi:hypothetical protein